MGKTDYISMDGCTNQQSRIHGTITLKRIHVKDLLYTKNPEIIMLSSKKATLEKNVTCIVLIYIGHIIDFSLV